MATGSSKGQDPSKSIQHRPHKSHGLAKPSRILSNREADTDYQYRPHIVDTDDDCGRRFCGHHFVDKPQMWKWAQLGSGGTERKRKGPCTKQCAWRKHGSCDTRLAEACAPKLWNTAKYSVEEMRPKWPFWKHRAPKMATGRSTIRPPEALLAWNPTWESPHFSGLSISETSKNSTFIRSQKRTHKAKEQHQIIFWTTRGGYRVIPQ